MSLEDGLRSLVRCLGGTGPESDVLYFLIINGGRALTKDLVSGIGITAPGLRSVVSRLWAKGLVRVRPETLEERRRRGAPAAGRRMTVVELNEEGLASAVRRCAGELESLQLYLAQRAPLGHIGLTPAEPRGG